jgi:hypothetical protein
MNFLSKDCFIYFCRAQVEIFFEKAYWEYLLFITEDMEGFVCANEEERGKYEGWQ